MTKKRIFIGLGIVGIIGLVFGLNYFYRYYNYQKIVKELTISEMDLTNKKDGVYEGEFDAYLVASKVNVTVKNQQIEKIDLVEHKNEKGQQAGKIIEDVVDQQSLKVDVISGATNSSRVILKSIERAVEKN